MQFSTRVHALSMMILMALTACGGGQGDTGSAAGIVAITATNNATNDATNNPTTTADASEIAVTDTGTTSAALDTSVAAAAAGLPTAPGGRQAAIGSYAAADLDALLAQGKAIWRAQRVDINGVNKGACANCHSSDGVELALWKFTDDDVRRRAHLDGVSATDRETLVGYFAGLRQRYRITALRDVLEDRPFQPKGRPFAGTIAERDLQFATQTFAKVAPTLLDGNIDTLAKALAAKEELRVSNPLDMQIGIPLPRISDDCFRGSEHCTPNDWMSDLPRLPKAAMSDAWFALNDLYIADPSDANLRTLLSAVESMTDPWLNPGETSMGQSGTLGTEKFKAMQVLQHFLRRQQLGLFKPGDDQNPLAPLKDASLGLKRPNFPFLVGDFSFNKDGKPWDHPAEMPVFVRRSLGETDTRALTDADVARVKAEMDVPWWYVGFMFDANLGTGTNTEYFFGELATGQTGGYPFHLVYAGGKHSAIQSYAGGAPANNIAFRGRMAIGDADQPRLFASVEARQRYRQLEANWTRMWLYLAAEQLRQAGIASFDKNVDIDITMCAASGWSSLRTWVAAATSFDPANAALTLGLYNDLIARAGCNLPALSSTYVAGNGTGLKIEWFEGSGDEFGGRSAALVKVIGERIEPIVHFPGRETGTGYYAAYTKSLGIDVVNGSQHSARGSGFVTAPVTGEYEFFLEAGFGRLAVDGREIYRQFRDNADNPLRATIRLQAGQRYPLAFERHGCPACGMSLSWKTVDGKLPRQVVPTLQMSPN